MPSEAIEGVTPPYDNMKFCDEDLYEMSDDVPISDVATISFNTVDRITDQRCIGRDILMMFVCSR